MRMRDRWTLPDCSALPIASCTHSSEHSSFRATLCSTSSCSCTESACSLSPDDYVFAALNLYLDIVQLFLHILRLYGEMSRN